MPSAPLWLSVPAGNGRRRHHFEDGNALRTFLYRMALTDRAALRTVRFPKDLPGVDDLVAWIRQVSTVKRPAAGAVETPTTNGGGVLKVALTLAVGVLLGVALSRRRRRR